MTFQTRKNRNETENVLLGKVVLIVRSKMEVSYSVLLCILLYFELITGTLVREITSQYVHAYDGTYENEKSLGISNVGSSMQCSIKCLNDNRCVSFFYNTITKTCILHADPFTYTNRPKSGTGWIFFQTFISKYTNSKLFPLNQENRNVIKIRSETQHYDILIN